MANCWKCGAEVKGLYAAGVLITCPQCKLLDELKHNDEKSKERQKWAERDARDKAEKERRLMRDKAEEEAFRIALGIDPFEWSWNKWQASLDYPKVFDDRIPDGEISRERFKKIAWHRALNKAWCEHRPKVFGKDKLTNDEFGNLLAKSREEIEKLDESADEWKLKEEIEAILRKTCEEEYGEEATYEKRIEYANEKYWYELSLMKRHNGSRCEAPDWYKEIMGIEEEYDRKHKDLNGKGWLLLVMSLVSCIPALALLPQDSQGNIIEEFSWPYLIPLTFAVLSVITFIYKEIAPSIEDYILKNYGREKLNVWKIAKMYRHEKNFILKHKNDYIPDTPITPDEERATWVW